MSEFFGAILLLKRTFDKYAGEDGDKKTLSKKELVKLLSAENPGNPEKQKEVEDLFKALDADGDGVVDFTEYVVFAASMATILFGE